MNLRFFLAAISLCALTAAGADAPTGLDPKVHEELRKTLGEATDSPARLRALWALHATGGLDARTAIESLKSSDEWVRAWTIQLAFESQDNLARLIREAEEKGIKADPDLNRLAESDPSPLVRSFIASAAQRSGSTEFRAGLVTRLLRHAEDAQDHNLPLMYWYAMEPLVAAQPEEMLAAAIDTKLPKILNFTARRIASIGDAASRDLLAEKLRTLDDAGKQADILLGFSTALKGQRSVVMPKGWAVVETRLGSSPSAEVRTLSQSLSLTFGSQNALAALRKTLADASQPAPARRAALDSLVNVKDAELPSTLLKLVADAPLRGAALRALAGYNEPTTPTVVLAAYASFDEGQKRDALNTLVSRPAFAKPLLDAVSEGKISSKDLTADIVRQLRAMKDAEVQTRLVKAYGSIRESSADKKAEMEKYRNVYRAGYSQPGDGGRGRVLFNKICAQCHTLFDVGGKVGPDITGANRADLNYLLETIVDPNAVIPNEYRTTEIETKDGRSLTGVLKVMGDKSVLLQTANELVTLPRDEIASQRQTELSMMPEGLLAALNDQEVRDLIYYLTRPGQVPLPAEKPAK